MDVKNISVWKSSKVQTKKTLHIKEELSAFERSVKDITKQLIAVTLKAASFVYYDGEVDGKVRFIKFYEKKSRQKDFVHLQASMTDEKKEMVRENKIAFLFRIKDEFIITPIAEEQTKLFTKGFRLRGKIPYNTDFYYRFNEKRKELLKTEKALIFKKPVRVTVGIGERYEAFIESLLRFPNNVRELVEYLQEESNGEEVVFSWNTTLESIDCEILLPNLEFHKKSMLPDTLHPAIRLHISIALSRLEISFFLINKENGMEIALPEETIRIPLGKRILNFEKENLFERIKEHLACFDFAYDKLYFKTKAAISNDRSKKEQFKEYLTKGRVAHELGNKEKLEIVRQTKYKPEMSEYDFIRSLALYKSQNPTVKAILAGQMAMS